MAEATVRSCRDRAKRPDRRRRGDRRLAQRSRAVLGTRKRVETTAGPGVTSGSGDSREMAADRSVHHHDVDIAAAPAHVRGDRATVLVKLQIDRSIRDGQALEGHRIDEQRQRGTVE